MFLFVWTILNCVYYLIKNLLWFETIILSFFSCLILTSQIVIIESNILHLSFSFFSFFFKRRYYSKPSSNILKSFNSLIILCCNSLISILKNIWLLLITHIFSSTTLLVFFVSPLKIFIFLLNCINSILQSLDIYFILFNLFWLIINIFIFYLQYFFIKLVVFLKNRLFFGLHVNIYITHTSFVFQTRKRLFVRAISFLKLIGKKILRILNRRKISQCFVRWQYT